MKIPPNQPYKASEPRRLTTVVACVAFVLVAAAGKAELTFTTNGSVITITGYAGGPNGALTIPSVINGPPVTSIGDGAFLNGQGIYSHRTSVFVPNSAKGGRKGA